MSRKVVNPYMMLMSIDGVDDVFVLGLLLGDGFDRGGVLSAISSSTLVSSLVKKC